MKSIIKFFKRRYKILIPVMVALVLLVSLFFLYRRYEYDNTRNKKEIPVYVKEEKPNAGQDDENITGLLADTKYTINGSEYTTNQYGKIAVDPAWRKTTVNIVRVSRPSQARSSGRSGRYADSGIF